MDKLIIIPNNIRGLGNIMDKKESSDFTTFHTNLFNMGSEVINDSTRTIFQIEYENNQLYFLEFPTKIIAGVNQTITAMVKNSEGNPINNATVKLFITSNDYISSTSDSQGILTFNNVNVTAGRYELYMIYNNIKSGKILITCVNVNSISTPEFIITSKDQLLRVPITIYDNNNLPVSDIPLTIDVQGNVYNLTTDETGIANIEYYGNELGDVLAHIQCGNKNKYVTINDCIFYIYNGLYGQFSVFTGGLNLANLTFLEEGFKISPTSSSLSSTVDVVNSVSTVSSTVGESAILFGHFSDVIVEFTYLNSQGTYGFNFLVSDGSNNRLFLMSYIQSAGKYHFITSNEDITVTGTLNQGDKFKIVLLNGNISVKKEGNQIYSGSTSTTQNMLIGFRSLKNSWAIYDKFMIKHDGIDSLKSTLINKGITRLINGLTYENKVIQYSTLNVENINSLSDFNGVIYDLSITSNGNIKYDALVDFESAWGVVESSKSKLENALTSLTYNSTTGDINFETVGDLDA